MLTIEVDLSRAPFARKLAAVALTAGLGLAASCSSQDQNGGSCASKGRCPGDKARSQSMIDGCNALLDDRTCGAKYQAFLDCTVKNEQCDSAGNVDATATQQACAAQISAWKACSGL
jgi:hypothetical protein